MKVFFRQGVGGRGEEVAEINSRFIVYVARWMLVSSTDMGTWKLFSRFVEFISQFRLSYAEVTNDPQILVAYKKRTCLSYLATVVSCISVSHPLHSGTQSGRRRAIHRTEGKEGRPCAGP